MKYKKGLISAFAILGTAFFLVLALILIVSVNKPAVYQSSSFEDGRQIFSESREEFVTVKYNTLENGRGLCADSDEEFGDFNSQSFNFGLVVYMYDSCNDINLLSGNSEQCSFVISASDVCKNSNVLIEQMCGENGLEITEVSCEFGCFQGACLLQTSNPNLCGDSNIDFGEQCDDGNVVSGDGCSAFCTYEGGVSDVTDALNSINKWKSGEGNLKGALNSIRQWKE